MLLNLPLNTQTRAHIDFAAQLETDPAGLVEVFLKEFNNCLFTRLAYQLCPTYNESPQSRAYYRPLIEHTAKKIIALAWQSIIESKPSRPIILLIGGGHGSGKLTACYNPAVSLQREVSLIYDGSKTGLGDLRQLIEQAHSANLHTILTFIQRPLKEAAVSAILRSTEEGEIPDPEEFAASHVAAKENFLSLVAHYKKKKDKVTPVILFNQKASEPYTTSHRELKQLTINYDEVITMFREAWTELQNGLNSKPRVLPTINKARRSKNPTTSTVLLVAHLLSQTLRRNISSKTQPFKQIENVRTAPTQQTQEPSHHHLHVHQEVIESSDNWRSQTAEGLQRTLDRQHPAHVVVKERKTHEHEMETTLER